MLRRLKQLKKLWNLTKKDEKYLEVIESLTDNAVNSIPQKGNNNAVFFSDMTETEYRQYIEDEKHGWKAFNNMVKNIFK